MAARQLVARMDFYRLNDDLLAITGYGTLRLSAVSHQLSVVSPKSPAPGYQLSALSHELSVSSSQSNRVIYQFSSTLSYHVILSGAGTSRSEAPSESKSLP